MNFDFSDEQNQLRDEVRKYLVNESPLDAAREVMVGGGTHAASVWRGLVELADADQAQGGLLGDRTDALHGGDVEQAPAFLRRGQERVHRRRCRGDRPI